MESWISFCFDTRLWNCYNITFALAVVTVIFFKNYLKCVWLAMSLPGPPITPILGNVLLFKDHKKLEMIGTKVSTLYKPFCRIWLSIMPMFIFYEPDHLQVLLGTSKYTNKNIFYTFLHNFVGNGLITSTGDRWKLHRKLIQPYFHINVLKMHFPAFCKHSTILVEDFDNKTDLNIVPLVNKFVLNTLQETVLSVTDDCEESPFRKGQIFFSDRITKPWLLLNTFFNRTNFFQIESQHRSALRSYISKVLAKRTNNLDSFPKNITDMFRKISENHPDFTEDDIIDEVCTFMLAGQDSVGTALTFTLYYLALHQDIQEKVIEEQEKILNNNERSITFEDVAEMTYLEQCIKESMRLCPSVPLLTRQLIKDVTLSDHVIPAGTNILISPFMTHRLPHIFPNPSKFDPERFSPENKLKIHPYAYIPFSAGPRNCIGYKFALIELKTAIAHILRKYKLYVKPGHEKLDLLYRITLKVKNGVWLRLIKK